PRGAGGPPPTTPHAPPSRQPRGAAATRRAWRRRTLPCDRRRPRVSRGERASLPPSEAGRFGGSSGRDLHEPDGRGSELVGACPPTITAASPTSGARPSPPARRHPAPVA